MCGIFIVVNRLNDVIYNPKSIQHRGPDDTKVYKTDNIEFHFYRLSINDVSQDGSQPFISSKSVLVCNGQIYNHHEIPGKVKGNSDCEKLLPLFDTYGFIEGVRKIDGVFATGYYDYINKNLYVARDPVGIRPLFYGHYKDSIIFSSEMKAIPSEYSCNIFPPGHIYDHSTQNFHCYFPLYWNVNYNHTYPPEIKKLLIDAVTKRVTNSDRQLGFFLSGGLDSSLIAAIGSQILGKITTFSIGTDRNSPDLIYARKVSEHLNTKHYEILFDPLQAFDMIPEIIKAIETSDITTIRASTPMYILSKWIKKNTNIKVLLSGEGSDEIFGGYLYFHKAPNEIEFHNETVRLVQKLHQYDVLRADRCTAAHGLEIRVPFLDLELLNSVMSLSTNYKFPINKIEKYTLRHLFSDNNWLPDDVLWRQKNAFSDAVGYNWVDLVKSKMIQIGTNEETYYKEIFMKYYENRENNIPDIWRPKWTKEKDPSARNLEEFKG